MSMDLTKVNVDSSSMFCIQSLSFLIIYAHTVSRTDSDQQLESLSGVFPPGYSPAKHMNFRSSQSALRDV